MFGDLEMTDDERAELDRLTADVRKYHSEFQIDNFIISKGNFTEWGMYVQVLRELETRREAQELAEIEIERLESKSRSAKCQFDRREAIVRLRGMRRSYDERAREIRRFMSIARPLANRFVGMSEEDRAEFEQQEWIERIKFRLGVEMALVGRPSGETVEMIVSLPTEDRLRILQSPKPESFLDLVESKRVLDVVTND